jgi:Raf kinase inhibitor-like YbhB/YbcL family protein
MLKKLIVPLTMVVLLGACSKNESKENKETEKTGGAQMALKITSAAFEEGGMIPSQFTCDGKDISPSLTWTGIPEKTKSIALICDDPDAPRGIWVHWVLFNLPPDVTELAEAIPRGDTLANGARQGVTDFGRHGYGGPCPPSGTHRYYFKLYALDTMLTLDVKSTKDDLVEAMEGHILAEAQLMGKYKRK